MGFVIIVFDILYGFPFLVFEGLKVILFPICVTEFTVYIFCLDTKKFSDTFTWRTAC
uniref:Uncharacterized protein n=1 Tax=Anguilla anguilla TaxID=7936 RepID=A0A0E9REK0_ANGAN